MRRFAQGSRSRKTTALWRFASMRPGDMIADPGYLGVARSEHPVFVEITLRRGRPTEKKQALYREIAQRMSATGLVRAEDMLIVLHENETGGLVVRQWRGAIRRGEQRQGRE